MELWPHQISAIQQLREGIRAGHRKQILMAPCGSGKTILACSMLQDALRKGSRAIFLVDRIVLVEQTSAVLDQFGLAHGVLQAGHWRMRPYEKLQVASAQTLERRGIPEDIDVLFVDEAHCLRTKFLDYLQDTPAVVVGLTATPFAKGLGKIYSRVVNSVTTNDLIASGGLKPLKYYAATATIDTKGMKVVGGEWSESEIEERGRAIIGDVVQEWIDKTTLHFGGPRKTLVFSATVPHGAELCAKFREAGYDFRQISYRDGDDAQRAEIIAEFRRPDTQIHGLIACEIFTKGFDVPDVQVGVSARPYRKSLSSHIQQLGRVMRASPGQEYGLWLDHCIASGQRVLTQRGLVAIEEILLSDRLWDGQAFVAHKGVVSRGIRPVIRYAGLTATPDHPVKTQEGWRSLGHCAEEQTPIVTTGVGGTALWERDNHFTSSALAREQGQKIHACALRVRHLWLSIFDFIFKPGWWAHGRVPSLQPAASLSEMALRTGGCDAASVPPQVLQELSELWRTGDRIPIRERDFLRSLDRRELGLASQCARLATGSHRQQRPLRARKYQVGLSTSEWEQHPEVQVWTDDAQIQDSISDSPLCGQDSVAVPEARSDLRTDCGALADSIPEAERQVWDILDAGPRNCFTCEGLLVHNSGNVMRMWADTQDVFANGMQELDDGAHDAVVHKEPTEKEKDAIRCACGYILQPTDDVCPACGKVRRRRNLVEIAPGGMVEIDGTKANRTTDWEAKARFIGELKWWASGCGFAHGWVAHKYREKFGVWPNDPRVHGAPMVPCTWETQQWIKSRQIAWARSRRRA